jgi:selenoprotein W-related protein
LTNKLLTSFKQEISEFVLIPSGGGCFELKLDGDLAYSKLSTGKFPEEQGILDMVGSRLKKR